MNSRKFFIGGPITNMFKDDVFDQRFKKLLLSLFDIIKTKGNIVFSAHLTEHFEKKVKETDKEIVKRDLNWIDQADICFFLFPTDVEGNAIRTDGTFIELGYACARKKVIYVFWNDKVSSGYSPMFRGMTEKSLNFYNISKVKEVIESIVS